METTLLIDGGLGRHIAAIPALEKYVKKNPRTIIVPNYWTSIYLGNKIIYNNVFDANTKGLFEKIRHTKIIKPEPYYNTRYINNQISMADAFNEEINGDEEVMPVPKIHLSNEEKRNGKNIVKQNNKKIVVFQPFGQSATFTNEDVIDQTVRSFNKKITLEIVDLFKQLNFDIALFDDREIPFLDRKHFLPIRGLDCRTWASIISNSDYFIGCDSSGQHIARCFDIPGVVIFGGTSEINTSYSDFFKIIRRDSDYAYVSYRLAEYDNSLANIQNSELMNFTDSDIQTIKGVIYDNIIGKSKSDTLTFEKDITTNKTEEE